MIDIIIAASVLGIMGIIFGIGLSIAAKVFAVEVDERVAEIRKVLSGANCGMCGCVSCDAYAEAVALKKFKVNACVVGGNIVANAIGNIMGVKADEVKEVTARVLCNGVCSVTNDKFLYSGVKTCLAEAQIYNGRKSCSYACLGNGDCVKVCDFDAIYIKDGIAMVNEKNCRACGKCVATCPKKIIVLEPKDNKVTVICSSKDKGPITKKNCSVGCIGCTLCVKKCPSNAINMDGHLAIIDYEKCTNCGECVTVCPTKAIVFYA